MVPRHARIGALILVLIASARIAATYTVFNHVVDEPAHIACGMEWLDKGTYHYEDQHPPLARIATAIGPYLLGARSLGKPHWTEEGTAILLDSPSYERTLSAARAGILPFFWIACLVVYLWAERSFGPPHALVAVFLFTNLPAVLAHAGLATTDMALTAMLGACLLATMWWFEGPSLSRAVLLGVAGGLALLAKFSSMPFFAAAIVCQLRDVFRVRARHAWTLAAAIGFACVVVWAGYRFSFGPVRGTGPVRLAPEFFSGLKTVRWHNRIGHLSYLMGDFRTAGFPLYYPVTLAVKTPLPYLLLLLAGAVACVRRVRDMRYLMPISSALGILAVAMFLGRINIGIRHILPVYLGFSLVAAVGAVELLRSRRSRLAGVALLCWMFIASAVAHPDYLAYFNELAGREPEKILIDSDLDWGQDMKRLGERLHALGAQRVAFNPMLTIRVENYGFPTIEKFSPDAPARGWNAAHITPLKFMEHNFRVQHPGAKFWPAEIRPAERVGKGILLWYVE